ncbi:hypothetical protein VNO78_05028 [Psophocarpus tetragonolobus]|uniref:Uncharacterized protein n=1 Tax=Psophocarpus tetragonolobus TaxID=3891 RepID=A0AAN9XR73_PSOTE
MGGPEESTKGVRKTDGGCLTASPQEAVSNAIYQKLDEKFIFKDTSNIGHNLLWQSPMTDRSTQRVVLARGSSSIPPNTKFIGCEAKPEEASHIMENHRLPKVTDHKPMDVAGRGAVIIEKGYIDLGKESLSSV